MFKTDTFKSKSSIGMDSLKPTLSRYLDINKKLSEVNARANELRDERRSVELDLAAAYNEASHREPLPNTIELKSSQLIFQVKKPGEWKKGWTLSKKQLQEYLVLILPDHGAEVFKEISKLHEPKLVANDYAFDLKDAT